MNKWGLRSLWANLKSITSKHMSWINVSWRLLAPVAVMQFHWRYVMLAMLWKFSYARVLHKNKKKELTGFLNLALFVLNWWGVAYIHIYIYTNLLHKLTIPNTSVMLKGAAKRSQHLATLRKWRQLGEHHEAKRLWLWSYYTMSLWCLVKATTPHKLLKSTLCHHASTLSSSTVDHVCIYTLHAWSLLCACIYPWSCT